MDTALYERFRKLVHAESGIELTDSKESLVAARIAPRMKALGIERADRYLELLKDQHAGELTHFLDAISTNFTHFFREPEHFEVLAAECKRAVARGAPEFRVWCAASSSGEEPWSLAMVLDERLAHHRVSWKLLSTDLSTRVLARAMAARYPVESVKAVPSDLRQRYLREVGDETVEVSPALRSKAKFARLNLVRTPYPMRGPFDVIFCRNVMIYFDTAVRQGLVTQAERLLRPGGLFIAGHTETLHGVQTELVCERPSLYRKPERAP